MTTYAEALARLPDVRTNDAGESVMAALTNRICELEADRDAAFARGVEAAAASVRVESYAPGQAKLFVNDHGVASWEGTDVHNTGASAEEYAAEVARCIQVGLRPLAPAPDAKKARAR